MAGYYTQNPLTRRATVPITSVAPTASMMVEPSQNAHQFQQRQMSQTFRLNEPMHSPAVSAYHPNPDLPSERPLPSKDVTDETLDNAYVQFILYCNPCIPADVDTGELRKGFRAPPKSDGKSFNPFLLFRLLTRLENKDIKTWSDLVIELGVEPPDPEKNQSTQKVQQYAVRLKRWLRSFHVDAFFNFLLGKSGAYMAERPATDESLADSVRDGIPPEEDLAVRALLPEWRPKRGRRKAEDIEAESEANSATKRQHIRANSAEFTSMFEDPYSAAPTSALQWSAQVSQADLFTAAHVAIAPKVTANQAPTQQQGTAQYMRWQTNSNETPSSYSQSAITPRHNQTFSDNAPFEEPKSAHPSTTSKSPSRARRRHGAAVSSAWPSSSGSGSGSGKLRGRPPSNRSVQEGPFSTFPANPNIREGPFSTFPVNPNIREVPATDSDTTTIQGGSSPGPDNCHDIPSAFSASSQAGQNNQLGVKKPSKLQLQVPEHSGGPVRLATPPRLLINGETDRQAERGHERKTSADYFNKIDDELEDEADDDASVENGNVDWKKRALTLKRKLREKEEELKSIKKRVLEAVM